MAGVDVVGLNHMQKQFRDFNMSGSNIKSRFLDMIGQETLDMIKLNTPRDTGQLADSWQLQKSENSIVIANDQQDLLSFLTVGTIRHLPNPFIMRINHQVDNMVIERLEQALAESHVFFKNLPGGKGRKFQQVGRTSAGFKGGISFAGRTTMIRAGTGRRQLKRRLSLRRRRGKSINPSRKDVKLG
jgi:hypothetical protein